MRRLACRRRVEKCGSVWENKGDSGARGQKTKPYRRLSSAPPRIPAHHYAYCRRQQLGSREAACGPPRACIEGRAPSTLACIAPEYTMDNNESKRCAACRVLRRISGLDRGMTSILHLSLMAWQPGPGQPAASPLGNCLQTGRHHRSQGTKGMSHPAGMVLTLDVSAERPPKTYRRGELRHGDSYHSLLSRPHNPGLSRHILSSHDISRPPSTFLVRHVGLRRTACLRSAYGAKYDGCAHPHLHPGARRSAAAPLSRLRSPQSSAT